ncbi:unnamed protein product [Onchocerca ochengi]|uniref:Uncharacterized protein n=1 Tax=Onchocerca ochengi TaxID=42157 RepID=A0A182E6N2_ONCOC|nr:unnamed protein product [Onchocerca ochengi]
MTNLLHTQQAVGQIIRVRNTTQGQLNDSLSSGNLWRGIAHNFPSRFGFPGFTVAGRFILVMFEHLGSDNLFQIMCSRGLRHIQPVGAGTDSQRHRNMEIVNRGPGFIRAEGSN